MEPQKLRGNGFIPKHGGYRNLLTYKKAEIIYDGTEYFIRHHLNVFDRTVDQMRQAARSGKQNIAEGSQVSGASKETELKLTAVARASLEELKLDYEDFLRSKGLAIWNTEHILYHRFNELNRLPNADYSTYKKAIENADAAISANFLLCLTRVTCYLLDQQIKALEQAFIAEGGIKERMTRARMANR